MILSEEVSDGGSFAVESIDVGTDTGAGEQQDEPSARRQVEAWLEAVALCFDLPEKAGWIDP